MPLNNIFQLVRNAATKVFVVEGFSYACTINASYHQELWWPNGWNAVIAG